MGNRLELALLGQADVHLDGEPVTGFGASKAEALLFYLAVTGLPHSRSALAGMLWRDMPESDALMNLRQVLASLRRLVGPHLHITRQTVRFRRDHPYWLDVEDFETGVTGPTDKETAVEGMKAAVALYRGDFLAGFYVRDAPAFEEWMLSQRARLRSAALEALHTLVTVYAHRGNYEQGINYARRLLELEPWYEEAHRQLISLLARSGQHSAALAQYERCRRQLVKELGVEPALETRELYERVLAARSASQPTNLPPPVTSLVGREGELIRLGRLLADPHERLITILGPGGVGKTRLAIEAGTTRRDAFLDGVVFVPLGGLPDVTGVLPALAAALHLSLAPDRDPRAQLMDFIRGKELLLILDNFEQLTAGVDLLVDILEETPQVTLLVTSRERLNLRRESLLQLNGLTYPELSEAVEPETHSAPRLFWERARRVRPELPVDLADGSVIRICQMVQGLPLGIELAAALAYRHPLNQIADRIAQNLDALSTSMRDVPARHRSLRAVFDHSWELLQPRQREVFAALSVFRGRFSAEAAEQVTGASEEILEALRSKSLLHRSEDGRYGVHEVLRQYAAERLEAEARAGGSARDRHCRFYVNFLASQEPDLWGARVAPALAAVQAELDNVRVAWRWAVVQGVIEALRAGRGGLSRFYQLVGLFQEGETAFASAVEALRRLANVSHPPAPRRQALLGRLETEHARFLNLQGRYDEAIAASREAVQIGQAVSATDVQALGHFMWGEARLNQRDHQAARVRLERALDLARAAGPQGLEAHIRRDLGILSWGQGDYPAARAQFESALALFRRLGDRSGESNALRSLGIVSGDQGDLSAARGFFEEALAIAREIGDRRAANAALHNLGIATLYAGEYAAARAAHEQALRIARELGDRHSVGSALVALGNAALRENDLSEAGTSFQRALRLFSEIGDRRGEAMARGRGGYVLLQQGEYARAMTDLEGAHRAFQEIGDRQWEGMTLIARGEVALRLGDLPGARRHFEGALDIARDIGDRLEESLALCRLGLLLHQAGEDGKAAECTQAALTTVQELGDRSSEGEILTCLGHALAGLGRLEEARCVYGQAVTNLRALGEEGRATEALAGLARLSLAHEKPAEALACVEEIVAYLEIENPSPQATLSHRLAGTLEPSRVYLTAYQILRASRDPRAEQVLAKAYHRLQAHAARITDQAVRRAYLEDVPAHRAIVTLFETLCEGPGGLTRAP
jgi:DNA-binding SARP family transcriptional activator/predicted ATPase/Tfp pilus assembly protein PilF